MLCTVNLKLSKMEKIYVIQDVKTKEYFWQYRVDEGFTANINEAQEFSSMQSAITDMQKEYLQDLFSQRFIEVKCYYKHNGA